MNPQLIALVAALVLGLLGGWYPTRAYYQAKEDQRAKVEAEAALAQEKKNVEIVTHYQDLLSGVSDWYQRNPVRVRVQGRPGSTACPAPRAEDVVLTVGGVTRGDGEAAGARLLGDDSADAGAH